MEDFIIDTKDFNKLTEKKEIGPYIFMETYTKTKMLLNQETFYEIIVDGLYDVCVYLYYNKVISTEYYLDYLKNIIMYDDNNVPYLTDIDIFECDGEFVSFVIACISIVMNYTFEDAVLYIYRMKS